MSKYDTKNIRSYENYETAINVVVVVVLLLLPPQVSERIISDGRLLAKSLTADVERLTREKQVAQERAETTKVGVDRQC